MRFCPQMIRNVQGHQCIDSSSIITHLVNFKNLTYSYRYHPLDNQYGFSVSKGNAKNHTAMYEVDPYQFNLRLHHFSQLLFNVKKNFKSWKVCDWLVKWLFMLWFMDLRRPRVFQRPSSKRPSCSSDMSCLQTLTYIVSEVKWINWHWKQGLKALSKFWGLRIQAQYWFWQVVVWLLVK